MFENELSASYFGLGNPAQLSNLIELGQGMN